MTVIGELSVSDAFRPIMPDQIRIGSTITATRMMARRGSLRGPAPVRKKPMPGRTLSTPRLWSTRGAPSIQPSAVESVAASTPASTMNPSPKSAFFVSRT